MASDDATTKGRILIIDDDGASLSVATEVLSARGYTVFPESEWAEVNRVLFREGDIDLVLVDLTMPALRGDRLVPILRRYTGARTPIVLYSGQPEDELRSAAERCGATGYLQKGRVAGFQLADAVAAHLAAARRGG